VGRLPVVEVIVLDANILIRAVLGRQVRQLLETYAGHGIRFYAPEIAYAEATKYLPPLLRKKGRSDADLPAALAYLPIWRMHCPGFATFGRPSSAPRRSGSASLDL